MRHGHHTRRSRPDPLQPASEPRWLVVRDRLSRVLESHELAPSTDLRAVLAEAREARIAAGWECEEIGDRLAFFFCARDGERHMIVIEAQQPPPVGAMW